MSGATTQWASRLFKQSSQSSPLQALVAKLPPAPPSARDLIIPPELAREMELIDAYADDVEEYGHGSDHTLKSLRELVAHLLQIKKEGSV